MAVQTKPAMSANPQSAFGGMLYKAKNYDHLIGMKGFSDKLLTTHFKLYQGYVNNSNKALEKLAELHKSGNSDSPTFAEIKRRLGWEMNGMRLHEYYFDNLGNPNKTVPTGEWVKMLEQQYGSLDEWQSEFAATGSMRGIGWAILARDLASDNLINFWIEEHNVNHLAGAQPLLVMDVYEHAFMADYGTDRAAYIKAFFENVNWEMVSLRW